MWKMGSTVQELQIKKKKNDATKMVTQIIPDMTPLPKRTTNNHARRRHH